jgi:meckelin
VFIDFCTIAKVSLLVLDEKYHGYYLHCRSPHQYADGSMAELVEMLHKEEAGLTVDRSLDGAPADVQSFEIFLTGEWRIAFDKIYSVIHTNPSINDVIHQGRGGRNRRQMAGLTKSSVEMSSALPPERALKAWKELSIFLQEFIDNNFGRSGLRRVVREATYWERISFTPPDITAPDQPCVFFPDRNFEYSKLLFLGMILLTHSPILTHSLTHSLL